MGIDQVDRHPAGRHALGPRVHHRSRGVAGGGRRVQHRTGTADQESGNVSDRVEGPECRNRLTVYWEKAPICRRMTEQADTPDLRDDRLWTVTELAAFLRISPQTVRSLISRDPDRLPPRVHALGLPRWMPSTVRTWAEQQSMKPRSKMGRPRKFPSP